MQGDIDDELEDVQEIRRLVRVLKPIVFTYFGYEYKPLPEETEALVIGGDEPQLKYRPDPRD